MNAYTTYIIICPRKRNLSMKETQVVLKRSHKIAPAQSSDP